MKKSAGFCVVRCIYEQWMFFFKYVYIYQRERLACFAIVIVIVYTFQQCVLHTHCVASLSYVPMHKLVFLLVVSRSNGVENWKKRKKKQHIITEYLNVLFHMPYEFFKCGNIGVNKCLCSRQNKIDGKSRIKIDE